MKKWLLVSVLLLLGAVAVLGYSTPEQLLVSESVIIPNNALSVSRVLQEPGQWHRWWPGGTSNNSFTYQQHEFRLLQGGPYNNSVLQIRSGRDSITSLVTVIPSKESSIVRWEYTKMSGSGPVQKLRSRMAARKMEQHMKEILEHLKAFAASDKSIYNLDISLQQVTDTAFVALRFQTKNYPSTLEIYRHIDLLKAYIQQQGALETNHPMLHVIKAENGMHEAMVAIPTNKMLPGTSQIMQKRMIPGKILVASVQGGQPSVEQALLQMDRYAQDESLRAPAIPFASLVTDRMKEKDTAKWTTKVYYPIY